MAFVQLMFLFYGSYLNGYASLIKSAETAFLVMLGKFDASEYMQQNTLIGPFIFSAYNIVMICFILNIFISIITDAFEKVRLDYKSNPNREFHFWSTGKMIVHNFFKNKQENNVSKRKPKYRDHISVFPKRVDQLSKYVIRVSSVKYIHLFLVRRDCHESL